MKQFQTSQNIGLVSKSAYDLQSIAAFTQRTDKVNLPTTRLENPTSMYPSTARHNGPSTIDLHSNNFDTTEH